MRERPDRLDGVSVLERSLKADLAVLDEFVADNTGAAAYAAPDGDRTFEVPARAADPLNAWLSRCSFSGKGKGLLSGTTVSFKDTIAVAGLPLSGGAIGLEEYRPDFDATVVRRALAAGATVVGKNAVVGGFGEGDPGRRPLNPYAPDHLTGGSSAGCAVAVVAGDVDVAFGGDQGGSVRIPAAWCGAVGLKPTFGLVSHFGVVSDADQILDHVGPITRTVEAAATALQAVAGYDHLDPRQRREVPVDVNVLDGLTDGVAGVRIGLLTQGFAGADTEVARLVTGAAGILCRAGAEIREVSIPDHRSALAAYFAVSIEAARVAGGPGPVGAGATACYPESLVAALNKAWSRRDSGAEEYGRLISEAAWKHFDGRAYAVARNARFKFVNAYDRAFQDVDLLLMPTCLFTAPEFGRADNGPADFHSSVHAMGMSNTLPFNYTGHPALAVPCGKADGLPVSLQLVGRQFDEALLLRAGYAFQHAVSFEEVTAVARR
ncbi:amidase family protein [Kribbella hippodromi]